MKYIRLILAIALCSVLVAGGGIPALAAGGKDKGRPSPSLKGPDMKERAARGGKVSASEMSKVKFSGKTKRNKRIKVKAFPNDEIVAGKITGLGRDGIYMDGEFFRIGYAKIVTPSGKELKLKHLFPGMKARVKLSYGTIEKTTIYGLITMTREEAKEARKMGEERRKLMKKERDALKDMSLPKNLPELEEPDTEDGPGGR